MSDEFANVYEDTARAEAYAGLEYPGTYFLAFRDLPAIFHEHVRGHEALDFGCGTGRSTRFLRDLGYHTLGVDIAEPMLARARARDPHGEYRLVPADAPPPLAAGAYDLVLAAFTFDNVPGVDRKVGLFRALGASLTAHGRIVIVVSAPAIYLHEWASFSTRAFPGNHEAQSGDVVRIVMLDVPDRRPVEDILCTDDSYRAIFDQAGLATIGDYHPLGLASEHRAWISETSVAPWTIYVLGRQRAVLLDAS
jgi:SAM-dependent methyltransferase